MTGPEALASRDRLRAGARLVARGLSVWYPGRRSPALDDVDLEVEAGERIALMGPSGSGKSTLALAFAGIVPSTIEADLRGTVWIDGRDVSAFAPGALAERIGVLFQDPSSQFTMARVEDEVAFGLENLGRHPETMPEQVERVLRAVGLLGRGGWAIDRLSGGQQKRVALAATLAMDPAALVLDEPTAHLDPHSAALLYDWIQVATEHGGRTVVVLEHALDRVIAGQVERCVVLDAAGRIAVDAPIATVLGTRVGALRCFELGVQLPSAVRLALLLDPAGSAPPPLSPHTAAEWIVADPDRVAILRAAALGGVGQDGSPGPGVIDARGVTVSYRTPAGEVTGVRDVDLAVGAGEFVALVGPNGCGKSTLLRALTGVVPLGTGVVTVDGVEVSRSGPDPRLVGHVFQNPEAAFVADTVHDEVAWSARAIGWREAEVVRSTTAILERFGLAAFAAANPFTLSQGQKRRLSVAAAMVVHPRALVLDEPTFGQDARSAAALLGEITAVQRDGTAVVVATHDVELATEVADRVVALDAGRKLADTDPSAFQADDALLCAAGQVRSPLRAILELARSLDPGVPAGVRWIDIEREIERRSRDGRTVPVAGETRDLRSTGRAPR